MSRTGLNEDGSSMSEIQPMVDEEDELQKQLKKVSTGINYSLLAITIVQALAAFFLMMSLEYFW